MKRSIPAAALFIGLLLPDAAWSYIRPAGSILVSMASRRARMGFKTLVAEGRYTKDGKTMELWEAILSGRAYRVELRDGDNTSAELTVGKRLWRFKLGTQPGAPVRAAPDLIMTFLGTSKRDSGAARSRAFLRHHRIDESDVSLGRFGKRVVYIIGAKPGDLSQPQLWVDKEYLVPVRLISIDRTSKEVTDVRLTGYGSGATNEWFPQRIETYKGDKLVETRFYKNAELNVVMDNKVFEAPQ